MAADPLEALLQTRRRQSLWRERRVRSPAGNSAEGSPEVVVDGKLLVNFCSNDYLGLSQHPEVIEASIRALRSHGSGSGAAALITGYTDIHAHLEQALAEFCGRPRALLFPSGYLANLGMVGALAGPGVHVFEDRLNHASLLDGALLARARLIRYDHADPAALHQRLTRSTAAQKLVISEGVFSMDGDIAPLPALAKLCREHAALLCVDDAHGFGVLGDSGRGSEEHHAMAAADIPLFVATFGKALGCSGAFVAGDDKHIDALIQYARTYIYTTSMPPANAAGVLRALQLITEEPERRAHLHKLINRFREIAASLGLQFAASATAIQPFIVGPSEQALLLSEQLRESGFWVTAIRPPTVAEGSARLRITLTAAHQEAEIEALLQALHACSERTGGRTT